MTEMINPLRQCRCALCDPREDDDLGTTERHCADNTVETVTTHGWSSLGIQSSDGVPPWAFSIGLWHTYGVPDVAMFGLNNPDMQHWVNAVARQIIAGQPVDFDDTPRYGILPNDFPVLLRPVHPTWYAELFGTALRFYGPAMLAPFAQVVWPDRHGHFPWEPEAGDACKANQPQLWLPVSDHPPSLWADLEAIHPWPFTDSPVRTEVYTTPGVLDGTPITGIARDLDGSWQFLDGTDIADEDIRVVHLHHLYARQPVIGEHADLRPGYQRWRHNDGWHESAFA